MQTELRADLPSNILLEVTGRMNLIWVFAISKYQLNINNEGIGTASIYLVPCLYCSRLWAGIWPKGCPKTLVKIFSWTKESCSTFFFFFFFFLPHLCNASKILWRYLRSLSKPNWGFLKNRPRDIFSPAILEFVLWM